MYFSPYGNNFDNKKQSNNQSAKLDEQRLLQDVFLTKINSYIQNLKFRKNSMKTTRSFSVMIPRIFPF